MKMKLSLSMLKNLSSEEKERRLSAAVADIEARRKTASSSHPPASTAQNGASVPGSGEPSQEKP